VLDQQGGIDRIGDDDHPIGLCGENGGRQRGQRLAGVEGNFANDLPTHALEGGAEIAGPAFAVRIAQVADENHPSQSVLPEVILSRLEHVRRSRCDHSEELIVQTGQRVRRHRW